IVSSADSPGDRTVKSWFSRMSFSRALPGMTWSAASCSSTGSESGPPAQPANMSKGKTSKNEGAVDSLRMREILILGSSSVGCAAAHDIDGDRQEIKKGRDSP